MFIAKFICKSCRDNDFIDGKNPAHPMIYAFGPAHRLQSNALDAPLKRHMRYGRFTMDMLEATGEALELRNQTVETGVKREGDLKRDHDRANVASGGVPAKLGFEHVRDAPQAPEAPGEEGVERVWRLTRAAWEAARAAPPRGRS